ncbi:class I SAM-dependent methyltransferase [Halalkalibacterium ligniniphilum]|uniref:class I SAM-dependent methyltransferase n=1 Tax=Halalkalibacterium ligniniphilum TaxID=1134413 RepID=UPI000349FB2B|nr:rRNA adenine N-6-methyltransferase family protein [Halalkalibacterium ligniniphilum]
MLNEKKMFLKSFLDSPKSVGSIIPSSKYLVQCMLNQADLKKDSKVVELGGGTGVLTGAIVAAAQFHKPLLVFEQNDDLRQSLSKYSGDITLFDDAFELGTCLSHMANQIDCVFSGLPLLNFKKGERVDLLDQIYFILKPGGKFIAFQYTPFLLPYMNDFFESTTIKVVPLNIPPAFVFVCEKKA